MIAGRYALEREIGRGGMGAVWLGRDEVLGRQVAIKRVGAVSGADTQDLRDADLQRAEREAKLAARLNHPHVVAVYDLVIDEDARWLVMEYVEGEDLGALVKRAGPLDPDRAAHVIGQAAEALAQAHAARIVHRDVKPSNIMVTPTGQVKLTDFGIARAEADASLTQTGLVTGSPAYLSPEVASGSSATPASDVWALGATLYYALEGRPPYDAGDNVIGTLYKIVHETPPRPASAGWLEPLTRATMSHDVDQRWTMSQVRGFLTRGPQAPAPPVQPGGQPAADPVPTSTVLLDPAPVGPPPRPSRPQRARRSAPVVPILVGVCVLVFMLAVAAVAINAGRDDGADVATDDPTTSEPTSAPTSAPTEVPSETPSPSTSATTVDPAARRAAQEQWVRDYVATAVSDPKSSFERLTPEFQDASGGFGAYNQFWGDKESATVSALSVDDNARVTYTIEYRTKKGTTWSDTTTLQLVDDGAGGYLLEGEA